jgi:hypothetical protein
MIEVVECEVTVFDPQTARKIVREFGLPFTVTNVYQPTSFTAFHEEERSRVDGVSCPASNTGWWQ